MIWKDSIDFSTNCAKIKTENKGEVYDQWHILFLKIAAAPAAQAAPAPAAAPAAPAAEAPKAEAPAAEAPKAE